MDIKYLIKLCGKNFLFWLSRKIDYPLVSPDMVQVNFTFKCNLSCKMCSMQAQMKLLESQGRQIEIDSLALKKIIKEAKDLRVSAIVFIGGEPLLRRDLFDLIKYAKSLGLGTVIVTNGVLLNKDNIMKCFDTEVDWLSISIDAASEEVFRKIRGEKTFGKIIENIELLNTLKQEQKREFPKINVVCTIMDDNPGDLYDVVRLCRKLKAEKIMFQPVVANNIDQTQRVNNTTGLISQERLEKLDEAIDKLINYKKESLDNFDFIVNNIRHLKLIKKYFRNSLKHWELPCYAGYNRLQIVQEGKIYFCVPQDKYRADFGDIRKDALSDLWFSKEAKKRRRLIRACKVPCLQWCSYRDGFIELSDIFEKIFLFGLKK